MTIDLETWRPVVGYEGLYSISSLGQVRSEARTIRPRSGGHYCIAERILTPHDKGRGYLYIFLSRQGVATRRMIAHLVADAFLGPRPEGLELCHCDGNSLNNAPSNLRYDTRVANHADKRKHGTLARGERHGGSKLSEADVAEIRKATDSQRAIAARFGIAQSAVSMIRGGSRWTHSAGASAQPQFSS